MRFNGAVARRATGPMAAAVLVLVVGAGAPAHAGQVSRNDRFSGATRIGVGDSVDGTTVGASTEAGEPVRSCADEPGGGSVWYELVAPATGTVDLTLLTSADLGIGVYSGKRLATLTEVACVWYGTTSGDVRGTFRVADDSTYFIVVS